MAEPARRLEDETQPYERSIPGRGNNAQERAQSNSNAYPGDELAARRKLRQQEENPNKPSTESIADQEENGSNVIRGPWENNVSGEKPTATKASGRFSFAKKKGPLTAIILTLIGGSIGIGGLLSPGLLLVHLKETFTNALDNASPALSIRTNKMLFNKFKTTQNSFTESSDGKCNIKCRFGSMNDTMKRNFEAKGFKFNNPEEGKGLSRGRWLVTSMEFPDGHIVTNGAEFSEAMKDPARASSFKKVFNSKTAYFLNSKFGMILREKFGLNKLSELTTKLKEKTTDKVTSVKDKIKASIRETLNLPPIDPNAAILTPRERIAASGKFQGVLDFIDGPVAKAGEKTTNILAGVCAAYNVAKGITYAAKVGKIAAFVGFAMIFLNAADQIKAGDADPDVISALGDQLTQVDSNGKSATDSLGYQIDAFGSTNSATDTDKLYSTAIGATTAVGILATITTFLGSTGKTAMATARTACRAVASPFAQLAASCPEEILAAVATGFETVGVGALASAVVCAGKMLLTGAVIGGAIGAVLINIIPAIANKEIPALDGDTIGSAAGDSLHTGTAQIFNGMSASYGLKAGNTTEIKQFTAYIADMRKQEDAIASYNARETPFDAYNQYSFLGSIAQKLNIGSLYGSSLLSYFGGLFSIIPKSFATLTNSVGAEANNKASLYDNKCSDDGLKLVGVGADALCNPSYVMSAGELDADINTITDRMIAGGYINEDTGEVIFDDTNYSTNILTGVKTYNMNDYKLYLDNCANRTGPLGETSAQVESDNYEWEVGIKCTENSQELSNFRTYTMDKSINDTMDE